MDDRAILRISPENFISVAILTAAGYLGIVGIKMLIDKVSSARAKAA